MNKLPTFVDMVETPAEMQEDMGVSPMKIEDMPMYPWGLRIRFSEKELEKLDLDDNVAVGDTMTMMCLVRVSSVSENETMSGCCKSVEMQITHIACEDSPDESEGPDAGLRRAVNIGRMYKDKG